MSKKELAKTQESNVVAFDLSSEVESYAANNDYNDFTNEDLITPRLRVLQSLSKQLKKNKPEFIEGAQAGMIYNTATRECIDGAEGVIVVPCLFNKEWIEWIPQNLGGGLKHRWGEDESFMKTGEYVEEKGRWVKKDKDGKTESEIAHVANYYVVVVRESSVTPAILTLSGTEYKKSRQWATLISAPDYLKSDGSYITPPPFYKSYHITTIPESNDAGDWFGFRINQHKIVPELKNGQAVWDTAKQFRELVLSGNIKVQADSEDVATNDDTAI